MAGNSRAGDPDLKPFSDTTLDIIIIICFPVSIMHKESSRDKKMDNAVGAAIRVHLHEPAGDILVFLTGYEECESAVKLCYQRL